jgi:hypothetical protein
MEPEGRRGEAEVKVRIVTVVEVDPEKWKQVAGMSPETKPRPVQDNLRQYVTVGIEESLRAMGMIEETEATVTTSRE